MLSMISFGIIDIIDIIAVALLLYYIYRLMRESGSDKIFYGIILFVLSWLVVTGLFEMRLLGSIMDKLVNVGAIALIILFQEEIRRAFSDIGSRRQSWWLSRLIKFRGRSGSEATHRQEVLPIVMACINMSRAKVGALIIIQRRDPLADVIRSGEVIDAAISQRLIENLFFKNSPLHDGAVVVSSGRIKAAGCILPVCHDLDIPKSLGLRHRSALGIAQKSDALAVIVSEETGSISMAYGGRFRLKLTPESLESLLTSEWPK